MKNSKTLFDDFIKRIRLQESDEERAAIAYWIFEKYFGLSRTQVHAGNEIVLSKQKEEQLLSTIDRVNRHEPIQYILGEAEFLGRKFIVNESVLIPRPETEELVLLVVAHARKNKSRNILDVGTGSGCIPVCLSLELPDASVSATDVSAKALEVARKNAEHHKAKVTFHRSDILRQELPQQDLDIIVSNPPYIAEAEKDTLQSNVVEYEPHLALFAPNDDPLIFYRTIVSKSKNSLNRDGLIAFEINERFGLEVSQLLIQSGFKDVQIIKDLSRKDRFVFGISC